MSPANMQIHKNWTPTQQQNKLKLTLTLTRHPIRFTLYYWCVYCVLCVLCERRPIAHFNLLFVHRPPATKQSCCAQSDVLTFKIILFRRCVLPQLVGFLSSLSCPPTLTPVNRRRHLVVSTLHIIRKRLVKNKCKYVYFELSTEYELWTINDAFTIAVWFNFDRIFCSHSVVHFIIIYANANGKTMGGQLSWLRIKFICCCFILSFTSIHVLFWSLQSHRLLMLMAMKLWNRKIPKIKSIRPAEPTRVRQKEKENKIRNNLNARAPKSASHSMCVVRCSRLSKYADKIFPRQCSCPNCFEFTCAFVPFSS